MPETPPPPTFLRNAPTGAPATEPDYLADQIADSVVDHLPDAVRDKAREAIHRPLARRLLRAFGVLLVLLYFAAAAVLLTLRYWLLPEVANYRPQIEQMLTTALQRPVTLGAVAAHWEGLHPALNVRELTLHDSYGRPALKLQEVDATLAWDSLLYLTPRLAELEIIAPELVLRRDPSGRLLIAGIEAETEKEADPELLDLLLEQHRIVVRDARVRWIDELRKAPELPLERLSFQLENDGDEHRFGLIATPPVALAAPLDLRGELHGRSLSDTAQWQGEIYLDLADADLAAWHAWLDYPLELTRGHGGLRLWATISGHTMQRLTADLRLRDVHTRLRADLPALDLRHLSGRMAYQHTLGGDSLRLRKLELETADGVHLPPTDLALRRQQSTDHVQFALDANVLDLAALTGLAGHLPLDAALASRLTAAAAQGRIENLKLEGQRPLDSDAVLPTRWSASARFEHLSWQATAGLPGASGISGSLSGDQDGGELKVGGGETAIDVPDLFEGGLVPLGKLNVHLDWDRDGMGSVVRLRRASIDAPDVAIETTGTWRPDAQGTGPGQIDLEGRVLRANATGAWRYIPRVAGVGTRPWLQEALLAGNASNGQFTVRGDLARFPFREPGSGLFEVRAKLNDVTLRYADSWPEITAINGELLFVGPRMLIRADSALSSGTRLSKVSAEVADLEPIPTLLVIKGQASGPTNGFLAFIENSPVSEAIDHFTAPMRAQGEAALDLELRLPLETLDKTTVSGGLRLTDNQITLAPGLPPLTQVHGRLAFTQNDVSARNLQGRLFGAALSADLRSQNGNVEVSARGDILPASLRQVTALPLFEHLSGSATWTGALSIGKRGTSFNFASDLRGLGSALPAPFAKAPHEVRTLRVERRPAQALASVRSKVGAPQGLPSVAGRTAAAAVPPPAAPDLLEVTLENALRGQWQFASGNAPGRGYLTLGRGTPTMPERDLTLSADVPAVDLDFWRRALSTNGEGFALGSDVDTTPPNLRFDLRAGRVRLFDKEFAEVRMSGDRFGSLARIDLRSAAFNASLNYDSAGKGRLTGVIPRLAVPESNKELRFDPRLDLRARDVVTRLPAIDLRIERLSYKERELGRLNIVAENRREAGAQWEAQIGLRNTEASLDGRVVWRPDDALVQTQVSFALDSRSIERTLERIGLGDSVRRGAAKLEGTLNWQDSPVDFDIPSLTGSFKLDAEKGQFNKLEPGVGRLLGILSLQNLPRRITLDFRDVFSDGFAFDSIRGGFAVRRGVMHTDDLVVDGPAAKVMMRGQIDLDQETQTLRVRVQPAIGESVALGAMIAANPVAGAVAWAAQKLLNNPLDQVFAYDYAVTGSWTDPKVDKLASDAPDPQPIAVPAPLATRP